MSCIQLTISTQHWMTIGKETKTMTSTTAGIYPRLHLQVYPTCGWTPPAFDVYTATWERRTLDVVSQHATVGRGEIPQLVVSCESAEKAAGDGQHSARISHPMWESKNICGRPSRRRRKIMLGGRLTSDRAGHWVSTVARFPFRRIPPSILRIAPNRQWQRCQQPRSRWRTGCCRPSTVRAMWVTASRLHLAQVPALRKGKKNTRQGCSQVTM